MEQLERFSQGGLIILFGLPATGKTTVAMALSKKIQSPHLNTDIIRIELGLNGHYDPASKEKVYETLLERCSALLTEKQLVIIDATMHKRKARSKVLELAGRIGIPTFWIELTCDEDTLRKRLSKKRKFSEADYNVFQKIKAEQEPLAMEHLSLDTEEMNLEEITTSIIGYLNHYPHPIFHGQA